MKLILYLLIFLTPVRILSKNPNLTFWNSNNPTLSLGQKSRAYCSYYNLFFLKEMNLKAIGIIINKNTSGFNLEFKRFGNTHYNQTISSLAYSKSLNPDIKIGIGIKTYTINQLEFNPTSFIIKPQFGLSYKLNEQNSIYTSIYTQDFHPQANFYPEMFAVNWEHEISSLASALISFNQSLENRIISIGINLSPNPKMDTFLQISKSEIPIRLKTMFKTGKLSFLCTNEFHQKLGLSNLIGISFSW